MVLENGTAGQQVEVDVQVDQAAAHSVEAIEVGGSGRIGPGGKSAALVAEFLQYRLEFAALRSPHEEVQIAPPVEGAGELVVALPVAINDTDIVEPAEQPSEIVTHGTSITNGFNGRRCKTSAVPRTGCRVVAHSSGRRGNALQRPRHKPIHKATTTSILV